MHRRAVLAAMAGMTLALMSPADESRRGASPTSDKNWKLSGPYNSGNLSLFLVHGPDTMTGKKVVTLQEAMAKEIVVVHETSDVNLLSVENKDPNVEVFIMAGDVVKGGKQDRAIAFDLVVPPKSGLVALPSFCVESGRWRKRGAETDGKFGCSDCQVVGRTLKAAVNESRQQGEVWKEVAEAQKRISDNVGKNVQAAASPSSLQLALEDKDLNQKLANYEKELSDICKGKSDVIGVAIVVNGHVSGVDVFGSSDLFCKLWPKLLKSAATEAFAESDKLVKFKLPTAQAVESFMAEAAAGESKEVPLVSAGSRGLTANNIAQQGRVPTQPAENVKPAPPATNYRCKIVQVSQKKSILVESHDNLHAGVVWHRCYIAKDEPPAKPANPPQQRGVQQEEQKRGRGR